MNTETYKGYEISVKIYSDSPLRWSTKILQADKVIVTFSEKRMTYKNAVAQGKAWIDRYVGY